MASSVDQEASEILLDDSSLEIQSSPPTGAVNRTEALGSNRILHLDSYGIPPVRAVKNGLRWMRDNPAEKVREALPKGARMETPESHFPAIRDTQKVASPDALMPDGAPEVVVRFATVSDRKVRAAHVNASELYLRAVCGTVSIF
jgi:hypothetical protein